jgi:hypothetical protein
MGIDLLQYKRIIPQMERMVQLVQKHQLTCGASGCSDSHYYQQKIEELYTLQEQIEAAAAGLRVLRLLLHTKSREAYGQLKADDRNIRRCSRRGE